MRQAKTLLELRWCFSGRNSDERSERVGEWEPERGGERHGYVSERE